MTDFHSHILPAVDDGAQSVEESLSMLAESAGQGVSHIIATPHFYADRDTPERFLARRERALAKLSAETDGGINYPELTLGAEVAYFEGMDSCKELGELRIEGTKTILIEMPWIPWNSRMISEVAGIFDKCGLVPIIAHIDRYIEIFKKKNMADWFEGLPVIIQANAGFFCDRKTQRLALKMLNKGKIHLIGSDMHNMTTRKPNMGEAMAVIEKRAGENFAENIARMEKAVLQPTRRYIFEELSR